MLYQHEHMKKNCSESREDLRRSSGPGEDPLGVSLARWRVLFVSCALGGREQAAFCALMLTLPGTEKDQRQSGTPTPSQKGWRQDSGRRGKHGTSGTCLSLPMSKDLPSKSIPSRHQQAETLQGEQGPEGGRVPRSHHDSAFTSAKWK